MIGSDNASSHRPTAATRLVALRFGALRRRWKALTPWQLAAWVSATVLTCVLSAWALRHLAFNEGELSKAALERWREHVFWLNACPIIIWSYTSFELIFRSRDAAYLNTLPIAGKVRSLDVISRNLLYHAPLALPALIHAGWLLHNGQQAVGLYALSVVVLAYPSSLACAMAIHLAAGSSLLTDPTAVRKMLAGQVVASEDAMLLWSPAAALLVGLLIMVVSEILIFHGVVAGRSTLVSYPFVVCAIVSIIALRRAHSIVVGEMFGIIARFAQAEVPPPYTEQGLPETARSERFAVHLPEASRAFFLRDRRQLRRRFRADSVVLVLFAVAAGRLAFGAAEPGLHRGATLLTAWLAVCGLLLPNAFRVRGELAAPYLDETLPHAGVAERRGRLAAAAVEPLMALVIAATAALLTGDLAAGAWVVLGGVGLAIPLLTLSDRWAQRTRTRIGWASTLWRVGILGLVSVATGLLSNQGGAG